MTFSPAVLNAALRHVYTAVAAVTGTLTVVGMSQGDATAIGTAIHQIGDGLASIATGVATLVPIVMSAYAGWTATRKSQVASVAAVPGTTVKVPDQKLADELPSNVKAPKDGPIK